MSHHSAYGILVPRPGIEPRPSAVKAWSLNTGPLGNSWHAMFVEWMYDCQIHKRKKTMPNSSQGSGKMKWGETYEPQRRVKGEMPIVGLGDTAVTHSEFLIIGVRFTWYKVNYLQMMLKLKLQHFGRMMQRAGSSGRDPDAGENWGQEKKGAREDEMVGWHHRFSGHEFERVKIVKTVKDREAWRAAVHGVAESDMT